MRCCHMECRSTLCSDTPAHCRPGQMPLEFNYYTALSSEVNVDFLFTYVYQRNV